MTLDKYEAVNGILVDLFNDILDIESKAVITGDFDDITNNDMHIIEAIGDQELKNMSTVAKALNVTLGTLTIAINSLVKKGYVTRQRSERDKRVVFISLLPKGVKAYNHHQKFHKDMVEATIRELGGEEIEVLIRALQNLKGFFLNI